MKSIRFAFLFLALASTFISCSKGGDDDDALDCEDANTTKVTFRNVWDQPIRVHVSVQLTPQYEPIDPVVTLDLTAGQSVTRDVPADRYQIVWKNGCPSNCSLASSYAKTYDACGEYDEHLSE